LSWVGQIRPDQTRPNQTKPISAYYSLYFAVIRSLVGLRHHPALANNTKSDGF
jgi:hypothetical protein